MNILPALMTRVLCFIGEAPFRDRLWIHTVFDGPDLIGYDLSHYCPEELKVYGKFQIPADTAYDFEKITHTYFNAKRIHADWYNIGISEMEEYLGKLEEKYSVPKEVPAGPVIVEQFVTEVMQPRDLCMPIAVSTVVATFYRWCREKKYVCEMTLRDILNVFADLGMEQNMKVINDRYYLAGYTLKC